VTIAEEGFQGQRSKVKVTEMFDAGGITIDSSPSNFIWWFLSRLCVFYFPNIFKNKKTLNDK